MNKNRDDFSAKIKERLAKRSGYICSFQPCQALTIGSNKESKESTSNIGFACHISGAAPGSKRYNKNITSEERKSIENGIWMCGTHAKLIDTDEKRFTVDLLKQWKKEAEEKTASNIGVQKIIISSEDYPLEKIEYLQGELIVIEGLIIDILKNSKIKPTQSTKKQLPPSKYAYRYKTKEEPRYNIVFSFSSWIQLSEQDKPKIKVKVLYKKWFSEFQKLIDLMTSNLADKSNKADEIITNCIEQSTKKRPPCDNIEKTIETLKDSIKELISILDNFK